MRPSRQRSEVRGTQGIRASGREAQPDRERAVPALSSVLGKDQEQVQCEVLGAVPGLLSDGDRTGCRGEGTPVLGLGRTGEMTEGCSGRVGCWRWVSPAVSQVTEAVWHVVLGKYLWGKQGGRRDEGPDGVVDAGCRRGRPGHGDACLLPLPLPLARRRLSHHRALGAAGGRKRRTPASPALRAGEFQKGTTGHPVTGHPARTTPWGVARSEMGGLSTGPGGSAGSGRRARAQGRRQEGRRSLVPPRLELRREEGEQGEPGAGRAEAGCEFCFCF